MKEQTNLNHSLTHSLTWHRVILTFEFHYTLSEECRCIHDLALLEILDFLLDLLHAFFRRMDIVRHQRRQEREDTEVDHNLNH